VEVSSGLMRILDERARKEDQVPEEAHHLYSRAKGKWLTMLDCIVAKCHGPQGHQGRAVSWSELGWFIRGVHEKIYCFLRTLNFFSCARILASIYNKISTPQAAPTGVLLSQLD
jgi:hypothetical protein